MACLIAYGASLRYAFVSDDLHLIVDKLAAYRQSFPLAESFTKTFWKGGGYGALAGESKDYYRPLVTLSYALDARVGGGRALSFHLTNLLLHAVTSFLVLRLALRLRWAPPLALAAALLFAAHPAHVASVAWISGRTDVLCASFLLLAFDRFAALIDRTTQRRGLAFGIGLGAYACALLSKEMAASLPILLAIHALHRRGGDRRDGRARAPFPWTEIGAAVAITAAYVLVRASALGLPDFQAGARSTAIPFRLGVLPAILVYYWRLLLFPGALDLEVAMAAPRSFLDPIVIGGMVLLAAHVAGCVALLRRGHPAGWGLAWMLASLLPVAHIVPLVFRALVTEYWAYIPSVGFVIALAAGIGAAFERIAPNRARTAPVWTLALLSVLGMAWIPARSGPLRSDEAYNRNEIRRRPERPGAWISLAAEYGSRGDLEQALRMIREAEARAPRERGVQLNLGNVYEAMGRADSAEAAYRREILYNPASAEGRVSLADMRLRAGDEAEAARLYKEVLAQGAFPAEELLRRADAVSAAARARGDAPWEGQKRGLALAAGMLASLRAAGVPLDATRSIDLLDLELRLGRIEAARATLEAARAAGSPEGALDTHAAVLDALEGKDAPRLASGGTREAARGLASIYGATGRVALAVPLWRVLLRAGGISPEELNHVAVGIMRGEAGNPPSPADAEAIWRMLLEEKPDHPLALLNLGGTALGSGDRPLARARWSRFLHLYPDRPEAADVRARLGGL